MDKLHDIDAFCINGNLPDEYVDEMVAFFKILGDETRIRILHVLSHGELCVTDLVEAVDLSQSSVSHQLRLLRLNGLVKARREGRNIYYALDDNHVTDIFITSLRHVAHKFENH